jgi:hypothetical protein
MSSLHHNRNQTITRTTIETIVQNNKRLLIFYDYPDEINRRNNIWQLKGNLNSTWVKIIKSF